MYYLYDIKICFCFLVLKILIKLKKEFLDYISIKVLFKIKEIIIRLGKIGCSFLFNLFIIFYSNLMLYLILNVIINFLYRMYNYFFVYFILFENLFFIVLLL